MRLSRADLARATAFILLVGLVLVGCGSNSGPTSPYGSGTGGGTGGGTAFDSGSMTAPANYVRTFPSAGSVGYHCTFHVSMGMTGTVTVVTGGADSAVVTASGTSFSPSTVSIKPGGYVHWKVTGGTHTVTSN
jgi:plastocyanin